MYPSREAAEIGRSAGGTGFLVGIESPQTGRPLVHVVTAKHVVDKGNHVVRFASRVDDSEILSSKPEEWVFSLDYDIAILGTDIPLSADYQTIPTDIFVGKDLKVEKWSLFPGDEVTMIGRFVSHDGRARNKPVFRFGNISMLPDESHPVTVGDHHQVAFIVECRSLGGFSGSPVFVSLAQPRHMDPAEPSPPGLIPRSIHFLGMDCGHLPFWSQVVDEYGNQVQDYRVETNSGAAIVIPAWRILELLNGHALASKRKRIDDLTLANRQNSKH